MQLNLTYIYLIGSSDLLVNETSIASASGAFY